MTTPAHQVPDSALVERIMAGDEEALGTLYDRYAVALYVMLVRILRDTSTAEEVLQDLFLQLWLGAARFDASRGSLAAWLLVIGRNCALSRLRGRERREMRDDPEGFTIEAVPSPGNLENEAVRAELMERLQKAMATLPPEQREAVELAYFEGMTQTEIAERTGSRLGTVKSRVRAALVTLSRYFKI